MELLTIQVGAIFWVKAACQQDCRSNREQLIQQKSSTGIPKPTAKGAGSPRRCEARRRSADLRPCRCCSCCCGAPLQTRPKPTAPVMATSRDGKRRPGARVCNGCFAQLAVATTSMPVSNRKKHLCIYTHVRRRKKSYSRRNPQPKATLGAENISQLVYLCLWI